MWTSVPQMALFTTRIITSWTPTSGTGASFTIQMPGSRRDFTSAFITSPRRRPAGRRGRPGAGVRRRGGPAEWCSDHRERAPDLLEGREGVIEVGARVRRAHLRADAGPA